jgi:eukaryotic-like serine/threonine-protein kinase
VMDFGIALAVSAAAGGRMTETGLSLGTPHYMSPEQATAEKEISARSDIYSLGSVLYEMLTGNPPHTGASAQQIIMKIITEPAEPVTKYRKSVPMNVSAALAHAIEKLPADRFASAKAFSGALGDPAFTLSGQAGSVAPAAGARGSHRATRIAWSVATVALLAAAAAWMRPTVEAPFRRVDLVFGDMVPEANSDVAISPDGTMLAAAGRVAGEPLAIYLRHLDGDPEFRKLAGTETGSEPAFSPDNRWIVFRKASDRSLVKVDVNGGSATTVVPPGKISPFVPQWGPDDQITFTGPTGEYRVAATGGTPVKLPPFAGTSYFPLPDGSGVLRDAGGQVAIHDFKSDSSIPLIPGGSAAVYVKSGHILYVADGGLFAVKFDLAKRRLGGAPVRVLERVGGGRLARGFAVSESGVLVQRDAPTYGAMRNLLVIVEPGRGTDTVRMTPARYLRPRFSPDGRSIATEVPTTQLGFNASSIHTYDLLTGSYTPLTSAGFNTSPIWSPDGRRILFSKATGEGTEELFVTPADSSGSERRLTNLAKRQLNASQWVDDTLLFFDAADGGGSRDVFSVAVDSGRSPTPHLRSPFSEFGAQLSPDRTLVAYTSDETGQSQLWLRDFPVPRAKWNVSRGQANAPRWSRDGRFVYFWRTGSPDTLFRARIDRASGVVVQAPESVVTMSIDAPQNWDLHPDGKRFIVAVRATDPTASQAGGRPARYLILENIFGELRRLTAEKAK